MRNILFALLFLFAVSSIMAQEAETTTTVKVSTDKVKIDGKSYYIHIVRRSETLFSISKAYNVSQIEVAMENPDIYLGLQVDQALKIPIKDQEIANGDEDENYIYHVVKRRETLMSLTRKYDVKMHEILAANPGMEHDLKVNQVILIPKKRFSTIGLADADDDDRFYYHEVKPREGFFSLRRQYGVSEEIIRKFNPNLVVDGLKLGTILRIPKDPSDTTLTLLPERFEVVKEEKPVFKPSAVPTSTVKVVCDTFQYNRWRDVYNVALLLPFTLSSEVPADDSLQMDINMDSQAQGRGQDVGRISNHTANFLDFYQGVLIALDSLKEMGISINLIVFNTEKSPEKARALTREKGLIDAHLIIGPAYPECLQPIAEFALEHRIPIVSPLSRNNFLLDRNPYLFQVNPSFTTQLEEFTSSIDFCGGQNIVLIHEADTLNASMVSNFKNLISSRIGKCHGANLIHFKEVSYRAGSPAPEVQERISHSLALDRENLILVPSNNEAFVSDLLANLHTLSIIHNYPISTYGFPSWQRFRNVQVDYYYQLQLHLFTPFFVNYSKSNVKSFVAKYRDSFRAEPSQYSFQGYDVMLYFLTAMKSYGVDFQFCLPNHKSNLLQSNFGFKKVNSLSGFENSKVHMIQYTKSYDIIEVIKKINEDTSPAPVIYINEQPVGRKEGVIIR
ncbi:MAG: LysM peptidoglycan-binding domain-containing protein [Tenuifilaceae bacterium]|jgi:LysM repeat protein|nr:LysM peptidoglycan-binding domain-containing protein [Tenuifilaceae bacterium]